MIKYKLTKENKSIDFSSLNDVSLFKQSNPEWANIQPVEYEEEIIPEAAIVPFEVPTWRLRAILAISNLEQSVTDALDQLSDPQKTIAKKAWDFGSKTERSSPTVDFIKGVLNLTDAQVDDIFIHAGAINI
jgi:hypothetical protein